MGVRDVSRAAVGGYLKVLRMPIETAVRVSGRRNGGAAGATLALDRAEAVARDVAGMALGDQKLRDDARRRRAAADERERALRLRSEAERHEQRAEARLEAGREQAIRR